MAHRKVIVASDLPVIREVLNKEIAMLVAPEDINGWVSAVNTLRKKSLRDKISSMAFSYFIENYHTNGNTFYFRILPDTSEMGVNLT